MVGAGLDEDGGALAHRDALALDLEHAGSLEHDVDLVVLVRLLAVGLGRDERVDADLEARRLVDDLVAAAGGAELRRDFPDTERVHGWNLPKPKTGRAGKPTLQAVDAPELREARICWRLRGPGQGKGAGHHL